MANDMDLEEQLEGLFAAVSPEVERTPYDADQLIEEKIIDILSVETERSTEEKESPADTAVMAEIPSLTPAIALPQLDAEMEDSRQEPSSVDPLAWENRLQEQRADILNSMLKGLAGVSTGAMVFLLLNLVREPGRWLPVYVPYFVAYTVLIAVNSSRRANPVMRATVLAALAYGVGIAALLNEGSLSAGGFYLLAAPLILSILIRQRAGAIGGVASSLIFAGFLLADHMGWLHPIAPYRSDDLLSVLSVIGTFALLIGCVVFGQRMFNRTLTSALHKAEQEHDESVRAQALLEERADELGRTTALLQKRTLQLQTAAQVSSTATQSVADPGELMQQVVDLIHERFDLYYAGLYLTDEYGQWAVLAVATGETGRQMVAEGHRVMVDTSTPVGWCIVNAQARIALDLDTIFSVDFLVSLEEQTQALQLLSATRSQLALPLRSRGRVIGVLDLRSTDQGAFTEGDIPVLQTMTDQIAAAIDNAQLFKQAQAHLVEMEDTQRLRLRDEWTEFLSTYRVPAYERRQPDVPSLNDNILSEVEQAISQQEMVVKSNTSNGTEQAVVVVPIRLRDETIGVLGLQDTDGKRQWTDGEIALIEAVADQLALALENTRLLEETQQRAEQERIIADITAQVRASMDPETILQTAVRELGAALGTDRAFVQLGAGTRDKRPVTRSPKKSGQAGE